MCRVIYFIPLVHTGSALAMLYTTVKKTKINEVLKSRRGFENTNLNWPGRPKLGQGNNSWQWVKHAWLYLTYSRLLRKRTFCQLWVFNRGGLNIYICSTPSQAALNKAPHNIDILPSQAALNKAPHNIDILLLRPLSNLFSTLTSLSTTRIFLHNCASNI